jgi:hypothetical protein
LLRAERACQLASEYSFDAYALRQFFGWKPRKQDMAEKYASLDGRGLARLMGVPVGAIAVASKVRGWLYYPTGLFIRDYLLEHGEAYLQEIWRALKEKRKSLGIAYGTVRSFHLNYLRLRFKEARLNPARQA